MLMDLFQKACGAAGPLWLSVEKRGLPGAVHRSFPQPFALIGRDPRADLFLNHPRVGRRHAYLQVVEGGVYCVDLASRTGTRWEGGPARTGWLTRPQGIGIGPFVIQLMPDGDDFPPVGRGRAEPMDPLVTRPGDHDDLPRVILEFPRESSRLLQWRMNRALVLVGSSPRCKVRLVDQSVSGFHCSLVRTQAGVWVIDLLGKDGITVNQASVRVARLADGDELRVGAILIRIYYETPAPRFREVESAPNGATGRTTTLVVSEPASGELVSRPWEVAWPVPGCEAGGMVAPGSSGGTEMSGPALAMLLSQFGQMQQQMLHQFQQSTMMMFQMFGSMQTEQMEMIREELHHLREIGETLEALKAEVKAATERPLIPPSGRHPRPDRQTSPPSRPRPGPRPRLTGQAGRSRPRPWPHPSRTRLPRGSARGITRHRRILPGSNRWDRARMSMNG